MASPGAAPPNPTEITVVVKNPANLGSVDYTTRVPLSWTVGELKGRISSELDGNPPVSDHRLIFSGALLKDDTQTVQSVLGEKADLQMPQVFHLVTSASNPSTPSSSQATRRNPVTQNTSNDLNARVQQTRTTPTTPCTLVTPPTSQPIHNSSERTAVEGAQTNTSPWSNNPSTPQPPYTGVGANSPHVQNVYAAAYAAAFSTLSPGTPLPNHVGVFGFPGSPYFQSYLNQMPNQMQPFLNAGGQAGGQSHQPNQPLNRLPLAQAPGNNNNGVDFWGQRGPPAGLSPAAAEHAAAAARAIAEGDPARAAAAAAAAAAGGRPVRVMQFHIDLKLIMKLATLVFFVGQGASREKLVMYVLAATVAYMAQVGAFNGILRRIVGENNMGGGAGGRIERGDVNGNNGQGVHNRVGANGANNANARAAHGLPPRPPPGPRTTAVLPGMRQGMPTTWFGELKVALGGFLASLLPSWEPPELHRHPRANGGAPVNGGTAPPPPAPHRDPAPAVDRPHQD